MRSSLYRIRYGHRRPAMTTSWNEPDGGSSRTGERADRATLARSSDFGVKTTSGLRTSRCICRRSRWKYWAVDGLAHLQVVLGAQREEALDAGRRVLRALPLVAVGEQHDQPGGLRPLVLGRHDDWSMMICAPLTKSPNCASQPTSASLCHHRVAVLEAEGGVLREQRVVDEPACLPPIQVGQRRVLGAVS